MLSANKKISSRIGLCKISMFIFATLPMLAWYAIPFPVGLGYALVLLLSFYSLWCNKFNMSIFPVAFWSVCVYVSFMWMLNNGFELYTLFPPGGWMFFLFFLALYLGVRNFDLRLLKKYMRWIVLISAVLFWIQVIMKSLTGSYTFCFVPNLTGVFTYEGMTYAELSTHQMVGSRPSSIFLEPSYMAYYYVTYLAITWFEDRKQRQLLNKEILLIIVTLLALKSGSGMIGLLILLTIKLLDIFGNASASRRIMLLILVVPLVSSVLFFYLSSEMGQELVSRADEFSTENSSGFNRVVGGYLMFDQLDFNEQITGIANARERFCLETNDGRRIFYVNGVQSILLNLGYIGLIIYSIFYVSLFRNANMVSKSSIIVLLVMSLMESNYLNPYMMLLTVIPCADWYGRKKKYVITHSEQ